MVRGHQALGDRIGSTVRRVAAAVPVDARDRPWLALAVLPGTVGVAIYLATNQYPAHGAGLFTKIAGEIVANGYAPPTRIPGYTADGVPFAYPPLQFYVLAVLFDLGGDPLAVARALPGVAVIAASVPVYLLGRDVADSRPAGAAAAGLVALNPQVLEWHVTAGGVVRAFGFLYATAAIYAGYRAFVVREAGGDGWTVSRRSTAAGAVAFGLTLLTHPVYTLFAGASVFLLWLVRDRSASGFLSGLAIGLGGTALAAPWLWWIVTTHGAEVFAAAAGTHGGVGGGASALAGEFSFGIEVAGVAAVYLLYRRAMFLPIWLVVAELLFSQPRFAYTAAAVLVPAAVVAFVRAEGWETGADVDRSWKARIGIDRSRFRGVDVRAAAAVGLILLGTAAGGAYFAYETTLTSDPSTPEYIDDDAIEAMAWVESGTDADATFVVVGDAAEWFPALTDRTILVGHWGVEWERPAAFDRQVTAYETGSRCDAVDCIEGVAADVGGEPTHVYLPKGQYTVRGEPVASTVELRRSFERDGGWEVAYENDGVVIYEAVGRTSG